jgi:uroporphyrin-3 C-methyltransferase
MSDTPYTPQPEQTETDKSAAPPLTRLAAYGKEDKKKSGGLRNAFVLLSLLLLLAAVAGLAWRQVEQEQTLVALRADYTALQQQSAGSVDRFAVLQQDQRQLTSDLQQMIQAELGAIDARVTAQAGQLNAINRELVSTRLRLGELDSSASPLSEAEALLRLAQQRLVLASDPGTAAELFQTADELLRQLDDPAIIAVREILAGELAVLRSLTEVDVAGLYAQLGAQGALVDSLTVASGAGARDFDMAETAATAPEGDSWFSSIAAALDNYFVVTRTNQAVVPLLTTEQEYLLRGSIQLQIEQARLALLRADPQIYQSALDAARAAIGQNLQGDNKEQVLATLTTLRDTPILMTLPPLGATLNALRQLLPVGTASPAETPL